MSVKILLYAIYFLVYNIWQNTPHPFGSEVRYFTMYLSLFLLAVSIIIDIRSLLNNYANKPLKK